MVQGLPARGRAGVLEPGVLQRERLVIYEQMPEPVCDGGGHLRLLRRRVDGCYCIEGGIDTAIPVDGRAGLPNRPRPSSTGGEAASNGSGEDKAPKDQDKAPRRNSRGGRGGTKMENEALQKIASGPLATDQAVVKHHRVYLSVPNELLVDVLRYCKDEMGLTICAPSPG